MEDELEIELAKAKTIDRVAHGCRPEAPEPVGDRTLAPHEFERVFADFPARHACRHARADDGADGGARQHHRSDAEFVQRFDDIDVADAACTATAKCQPECRLVAARTIALEDIVPGADDRDVLVYTLIHANTQTLSAEKTLPIRQTRQDRGVTGRCSC
ncbi:hypothetical protein D3C80_1160280 [compost metagenome]